METGVTAENFLKTSRFRSRTRACSILLRHLACVLPFQRQGSLNASGITLRAEADHTYRYVQIRTDTYSNLFPGATPVRIVLLYPPPWTLSRPVPGKAQADMGPPKAQTFGGDEITMPQGLMSIAAQVKWADNRVTLLNLYAFMWREITEIIACVPAELYGLSCLTINRRGTRALSGLIRKLHPGALACPLS
jgi:hypothetical protein